MQVRPEGREGSGDQERPGRKSAPPDEIRQEQPEAEEEKREELGPEIQVLPGEEGPRGQGPEEEKGVPRPEPDPGGQKRQDPPDQQDPEEVEVQGTEGRVDPEEQRLRQPLRVDPGGPGGGEGEDVAPRDRAGGEDQPPRGQGPPDVPQKPRAGGGPQDQHPLQETGEGPSEPEGAASLRFPLRRALPPPSAQGPPPLPLARRARRRPSPPLALRGGAPRKGSRSTLHFILTSSQRKRTLRRYRRP